MQRLNGESSMEAYTLPRVKLVANGNLLYDSELKPGLCNNLEGWEVGGRFQREGTYVYL